jgi:uncharacterized protein (TIGR03435 family)
MPRVLTALFLLTAALFAQNAAPRPEFEVADIRLNTSNGDAGSGSVQPGGQLRAVNIPVREIIKFAYNLRDEALAGAPGWVDTDRYDITAKGPAVGSEETFWRSTNAVVLMRLAYNWDQPFRLMAQSLLADRFKLAVHQEQRPLSVYGLVVTKKGSRLVPAADTSARPVCTRAVGAGLAAVADCKNMTMADLGKALQQMAGLYADRDVIDATGLPGPYDFRLEWVGRPNIDNGGLTMPDALDKQLGLKLDSRKLPMPVTVIDHIERPSDN